MSVHRENITAINIDIPNNRALKIYEAKTDRIKERNNSTIIVWDFNISVSKTEQLNRILARKENIWTVP